MSKRDENDGELQVAAISLWQQLRKQDAVATELGRIYQDRGGKFDVTRVCRICKYAVEGGLADEPPLTPVLRRTRDDVKQLERQFLDKKKVIENQSPIKRAVETYCDNLRLNNTPTILIAPGDVKPSSSDPYSQFAKHAASIAIDYLIECCNASRNRGKIRIGVTWGRQLYYIARAIQANHRDRINELQLSFLPLVGLPIGQQSNDTLSSNEISKLLNSVLKKQIRDIDYDLHLVPAYFPDTDFDDSELDTLHRLLCLMQGWRRIFSDQHMKSGAYESRQGDVFECDFIWSSVSDIDEPFGLTDRHDTLIPFTYPARGPLAPPLRPVADCGGIPLWHDNACESIKSLEEAFARRWTGIRRHQWLSCVDRGRRRSVDSRNSTGTVLIAPTADKAQSVLYALRDGLINILILGIPCADRLHTLIQEELLLSQRSISKTRK
jgi:hypothetical protein